MRWKTLLEGITEIIYFNMHVVKVFREKNQSSKNSLGNRIYYNFLATSLMICPVVFFFFLPPEATSSVTGMFTIFKFCEFAFARPAISCSIFAVMAFVKVYILRRSFLFSFETFFVC